MLVPNFMQPVYMQVYAAHIHCCAAHMLYCAAHMLCCVAHMQVKVKIKLAQPS